jgi:hypothetical protein
MFKGAHDIASLSWFFCVMTKEQNQYKYRNISSNGNIAQHIKIICSLESEFQYNTERNLVILKKSKSWKQSV